MEYWHVNFWKKQFCSIIDVIGSGGYCCKVVIKKNTSVCLLVLLLLSEIAVTRGQTVINTRSVIPVNSGSVFDSGTDSIIIAAPSFAGSGGAVLVNDGGTLSLAGNVAFSGNTVTGAGGNGGAVALGANTAIVLSGGTLMFSNNQSVGGSGGAIYSAADVAVSGSGNLVLVQSNTSNLSGGAIYSGGGIIISGSLGGMLFADNYTSGKGGVMRANNGGITITNLANGGDFIIRNNTSGTGNSSTTVTTAAGALSATGTVLINGNYDNLVFRDNIGSQGAAIYSDSNVTISGELASILMTSNTAFNRQETADGATGGSGFRLGGGGGGVIYAKGSVTISNTLAGGGRLEISNNRAFSDGGAIFALGSINILGNYTDIIMTSNTAAGSLGTTNNPAMGGVLRTGSGGAAGVATGNNVVIDTVTTGSMVMRDNTAENFGGVIDAALGTGIIIKGTYGAISVTGNTNTRSAGGAWAAANDVLVDVYTSGTFEMSRNTAVSGGGAIVGYYSDATIRGTYGAIRFDSNVSSGSGALAASSGGFAGGAIVTASNFVFTPNVVSGIEFTNNAANYGGALATGNAGNLVFGGTSAWVLFDSNTANYNNGLGGAIYAGNGGLAISNTTGWLKFSRNISGNSGGAIYTAGTLTMNGSYGDLVFDSNTTSVNAAHGGAIYAGRLNFSPAAASGSLAFTNNRAGGSGGAIYVNAGGIAIGGSYGGLFISSNTSASTAANTGGGAFYAANAASGSIAISGSYGRMEITDNQAAGNGGAFYATGSGGIDIEAIVDGTLSVSRNAGNTGGAFYANAGGVVIGGTYGGLQISENTAVTSNGGAIYSAGTITISGNYGAGGILVDSNTAGAVGGAFYSGKDVIISATTTGSLAFTNNTSGAGANNYGGVIYAAGNILVDGSYAGLLVQNNLARNGSGGALFSNGGTLAIVGNYGVGGILVDSNTSSNSGGGLYGGNIAVNAVTSGTMAITNNTAVTSGGALYASSSIFIGGQYAGIKIDSNKVTGASAKGGALYAGGNVTVSATDDFSLINNTASGDGGGIYSGGTYTMTGSYGAITFGTNYSGGNGGAINASKDIIISATVGGDFLVNSNTAATNGGAFYAGGTTTITGNYGSILFANNAANTNGGAIYSGSGVNIGVVSGGTLLFTSNTAKSGGAISTAPTSGSSGIVISSTVASLVFLNNSSTSAAAADGGGAIYAFGGTGVSITGSYGNILINSNTSASYGGFITTNASGSTYGVTIDTVTGGTMEISKNYANTQSGGAINTQMMVIRGTYGGILIDSNTTAGVTGGALNASKDILFGDANSVFGAVTISNNYAKSNGGAFNATGNIAIDGLYGGLLIQSNTSGGNGGAFSSGSSITISGSYGSLLMQNNTTGTGMIYGGVMYANRGDINILGTYGTGGITIDSNKAGGSGGALMASTGNIIINVTTSGALAITNNRGGTTNAAGNLGGALAAGANSIFISGTYGNLLIGSNTATSSGGAFVTGKDTLFNVVSDGALTITSNTAGGVGGAIYSSGSIASSSTISGTFAVTNNLSGTASTANGGAFWSGSGIAIDGLYGGLLIQSNTSGGNGGAFYNNNGGIAITGSYGSIRIDSNKALAGKGGAFYSAGSVIISATDDFYLINNSASGDAGGIYAGGSYAMTGSYGGIWIQSNTSGGNGGAINAASDISINTTVGGTMMVSSNRAASNGGAFYSSGNITVSGSYGVIFIDSNTAGGNGGAIYAGRNILISATTGGLLAITKNRGNGSSGGGGLFSSGSIYIDGDYSGLLMQSNTAGTSAGGAMVASHVSLGYITIAGNYGAEGIKIDSNYAATSGGASYSAKDTLITANSTGTLFFTNNIANASGGAFYAGGALTLGGSYGSMVMDSNKSVTNGGAIYTGSNLTIGATSGSLAITRNSSGQGGALYGGVVSLTGSYSGILIDSNTAATNGGAIYGSNVILNVVNNGNFAITNNIVTGSSNAGGGAIYSSGSVVISSTVDGTLAITGNSAQQGGAIYSRGDMAIGGSYGAINISQNKSSSSGGAFSSSNGNLSISATAGSLLIQSNTAAGAAGALGTTGGTNRINITGSYGNIEISSNRAGGNGGVLYTGNFNLDSLSSGSLTVTNNYAAGWGGAFNAGSTMTIAGTYGSVFINSNTATVNGGAAYAGSMLSLNLTAPTIQINNNKGNGQGGAFYAGAFSLNLGDSSTLTAGGNTASSDANGGFLYASSGSMLFNIGNNSIAVIGDANSVANHADSIAAANGNINLYKQGQGTLTLNANNTYTGTTFAQAGKLLVNGAQASVSTTVSSGAVLGGTGTISGSVNVGSGGTITGGDIGSYGKLTVGNLSFDSGAIGYFDLSTPYVWNGNVNTWIASTGRITAANGTVIQVDGNNLSGGLYHLMSYSSTLVADYNALQNVGWSLNLGAATGMDPSKVYVQTQKQGEINLVYLDNDTVINYWDGPALTISGTIGGSLNDGVIQGGSGTWQAFSSGGTYGNSNWTTGSGSLNAAWQQYGYAMFGYAAPGQNPATVVQGGTVTVDKLLGDITASGMSFVANGYLIQSGSIILGGTDNANLNVSGSYGTAISATIASVLTGTAGIIKTGTDTLVLTASNNYQGNTEVQSGTLRLTNAGAGSSGTMTIDANALVDLAFGGTFANNMTGSGTTQVSGSLVTIGGSNTQSFWNIVSGGAALVSQQSNLGNGSITNNGTLLVNANNNWNFINTLTGSGLLDVNLVSVSNTFTISGTQPGFTGTAKLSNSSYTLTGSNFYDASLISSTNNKMTVGTGSNHVGNFIFNTGTVRFDIAGSGSRANGWIDTNTLDYGSGTSFVQIDRNLISGSGAPGSTPLLQQDEGTGRQLINALAASGNLSNLKLVDQNGVAISGSNITSTIVQSAVITATGYYDVTLNSTGSIGSGAGLYLDTKLTRLDLLAGRTTVLASDTTSPAGANDMKAQITGAGSLTINAARAIWLMNGSNSYTGFTTVQSGTLVMGANQALGNTQYLNIASGAVLDMNGFSETTATFAQSLIPNLVSGWLNIHNSSTLTLTGNASNAYIVAGYSAGQSGTITVDGAASQLNAGQLMLGFHGNGRLDVTNGGVVNLLPGTFYIGGADGATGITNVSGTGSRINAGSIVIGTDGTPNVGSSGTLNVSNGAVVTSTSGIYVGTNGNETNVVTVNINGVGSLISATNGSLEIGDSSLATFNVGGGARVEAKDVYVGFYGDDSSAVLNLNGGVLAVSNTLTRGDGSLGGTINFNSGTLQAMGSGNMTVSGFTNGDGLVIQNGGAYLDTNGHNINVAADSGFHGSGTGGLYKINSGTLTLNGTSNYTGGTQVEAGALVLATAANSSATAIGAGTLNVFSNAAAYVAPSLAGNYTFGNILAGGGLFDVNLAAASNAFAFSGSGMTDAFTGTVNFHNAIYTLTQSDFNAATVISSTGNTLIVGTGSNKTNNFTFSGGTVQFDLSGTGSRANGWIDTGALALNSGAVQINPGLLGVSGSAPLLQQDDRGFNRQLINALTVSGSAGNLKLYDMSGNQITSTSTVTSGYLQLSSTPSFSGTVATGYYTGIGLTSDANGLYVGSGVLVRLDLATGKTTIFTSDTNNPALGDEFHAQITGAGNLRVAAADVITINQSSLGNNSYTGITTAASGSLRLGTNTALGNTARLDILNGATVDINGKTQGVGYVTGSAGSTLLLNGGTLNGSTSNSWQLDGLVDASTGSARISYGSAAINIGNTGTDARMLLGGKSVLVGSGIASIGNAAGSNGSVTVSGSAFWNDGNQIRVGYSGTGSLDIIQSGSVTGADTRLGYLAGGSGTLHVGDNAYLSTQQLHVGENGKGSLTVDGNGRVVVNTGFIIGQFAGSQGSVTISDNGQITLSNFGSYIGASGSGSLTISGSGKLNTAAEGAIGWQATGSGTVVVQDNGSWQLGSQLLVGGAGVGNLLISGSGKVTNLAGYIGGDDEVSGGTGAVTVNGFATWQNNDSLYIGYNGSGTLTIAGSGTVNAPAVYFGANGGNGALNLNGGILSTGVMARTGGSGTATFNSGTLRATGNNASFITGFASGALNIANGGAFIDSQNFNIGVAANNGFTGVGVLTKLGSGTLTLNGTSNYSGGTQVEAGSLVLATAANSSTAAIGSGTLAIGASAAAYVAPTVSVANYTFANDLSGGGLFDVNLFAASNTFTLTGNSAAFTGTANFRKSLYTLANGDFNNATVISSAGNKMIVGSGSNKTGNFTFNSGTVQFDISGGGPKANGWIDTGVLTLTSGAVEIDPSLMGSINTVPLLQQDDGGARIQLINASNVIGSVGSLDLLNLSGSSIKNVGFTSGIVQGGGTVATGYYAGASLTQDANGLYVSSGVLTRLDLHTGTTTVFASDTVPPTGGDDMKAQITGGGNLAINASNSIALTNSNNSYSGTTFVNTGTLVAGNNHVLGDTALLDLASVFDLNGKTQAIGALSGSNGSTLNLHGGNLTISGSNGNSLSNGTLTGGGTLTVQSNTLTVNGANSGLGAQVNINQPATVVINNVQGIGNGAVTDNGLLLVDGASGTLANKFGGNGTVSLDNGSNITVNGSNAGFSGTWNIADSVAALTASSTANLGTAQVVINGTFNMDNANNQILSNVISGSGWFVKNAAGNLAINQANSGFSGTTIINGGTLTLGNLLGTGTGNVINDSVLNLATGGSYANNVSGSGTNVISGNGVTIGGSNTQAAWNMTGSGTMTSQNNLGVSGSTKVNIAGGDLSLLFGGTDYQFNQQLTGSNGTLLVQNSGTFGFGAATGTNYHGAVELQDNQFELSGSNTLVLSHATLVIGDNNFTNVGSGTQSIGNLTMQSGSMQFTLANTGTSAEGIVKTGTLNIGNTVLVIDTTNFGNSTLPLLQQDEGTSIKLVDYTALLGNTQISGTNLVDQNGNELGNSTQLGIVQSSATTAIGTYDFAATASGGSLNLAYTLTNLNLLAGQTTVLDNDIANAILHGADELHASITGTGNLQIDATHSITLNGANSYSGTTFANSGTLITGVNDTLGRTAELAISGSATVDLNGKNQTIGSLDGTAGGVLNFNSGSLAISGSNGNSTSNGVLTGSGALTVQSNTLTVNGANSGLSAVVTIDQPATVVINDAQGLGRGAIVDTGLLKIDAASGTLANDISSSGTVSLVNGANITVSGSNSAFIGNWSIDANGNLRAIDALGLGNGSVTDSGTLTLGGSSDWALNTANVISGSGMLVKDDANTVTINHANSYSGGTQINSGTLKLTDLQGTGTGAVLNNGGLDLAAGGTYANTISGTGVNTISGSTVTISGSNTAFSGTWSVTGAGVVTTQDNLGLAAVDITDGGILSLLPASGGWNFDNALTGSGTLYATFSDTTGAFDFTANSGTSFAGTVELGTGSFNLSGQNTLALSHATLQVDDGNITTVGIGTQNIGGMTFNGGKVVFNVNVPAELQATTFITTDTLALLSGSVGVNMANFDHDPVAPTNLNLLDQDNGNPVVQLIAANTVVGGAGNLALIDTVSGSAIAIDGATATQVTISEGGTAVANGYYNYGLTTGAGSVDDGLYVSYILRELDVYAGQVVTLDNTTAMDNELSAYVTGSGGLNINAGPKGLIILSGSNDYYGATTVLSGTLMVGNLNGDQIFANSEAMIIHDGAALDLNDQDEIVNDLQSVGGNGATVVTGSATLTVNSTVNTAFNGAVDGANGELVKTGSAALDLSSAVAISLKGVTVCDGDLEMGATAHVVADANPVVTMQGGTAGFNGSQLTGNGDLIVANNGGTSTLNLSNMNVTATGGDLINIENGSQLTANVNNSILAGDIIASAADNSTLNLLNNSSLTGKIDPLNVNIDNTSVWNVTASSSVLQLNNNGLVDFVTDGNYNKTLTMTGLSGNGSFGMNVSVATSKSDFLRINGTAQGSFDVIIKRSPADQLVVVPQLEIPMVYVQNDGGVTFNGSTDVGARSAHLQLGDLNGNNMDEWFLVLAPDSTPGGGGSAVLASAASRELAWFDNNTLVKRMGDLHMDQNGHDWDVWVQSYGSQYNIGSKVTGHTWELMTYGVNIGADKAWNIDKRNTLYTGVFGGYDSGDLDLKQNGGNGSNDAYSLGFYGTWIHDTGWYADWVGKTQYYSNSFKAYDDSFNKTTGDYDNWAVGTSLEFGRQFRFKDGWFAEPQVQASYVHFFGGSYTTGGDNVFGVNLQDQDVMQIRFGSLLGRNIQLTPSNAASFIQPYVKIFGVEQVSTGGAVSSGPDSWNPNFDGASAIIGTGMIWQIGPDDQLHLDYEAQFSDKYTKPFGINFGYRHQF
ncbi:MAG: autotransporter-associated beta strand repeat-containing protein [Verrucomicrobiales bacterium]|jgi:autotransporter-associated beta strand protein/predicted outer membrane repeat protein|nr:autotransporter-associated beta strand repeat-containing protein [Verrucomicrobiales bacterium]